MLALIGAESGLNPEAEHWGLWPDISFGYGQRIVLFHYYGDHTNTLQNIYSVRDYVFDHPEEDIRQAASKLAWAIDYSSLDGSALGGMVAYNAGSDERDNPEWMAKWGSHVAIYQASLDWAETYR